MSPFEHECGGRVEDFRDAGEPVLDETPVLDHRAPRQKRAAPRAQRPPHGPFVHRPRRRREQRLDVLRVALRQLREKQRELLAGILDLAGLVRRDLPFLVGLLGAAQPEPPEGPETIASNIPAFPGRKGP